MEATLKVIIGISDPLEKLVCKALGVLSQRDTREAERTAATAPPVQQGGREKDSVKALNELPGTFTPVEEEEPKPAPETSAPEPDIATAVPEEEQPSAIPDDETMRTLMDIAISKFAGVGSENSKDPKVLRDRKDVCTAFKQIARHLGADKPTKLEGEKRNQFLAEIEKNLYRNNDRIEWNAF